MTSIAIVDYGMGNYHSVERALRHAAPEANIRLCKLAAEIDAADRVVFPGQGAMADCIRTLDEAGLRDSVLRAAASKPLLGVCVGMQMLLSRSEEGPPDIGTPGLNLFRGEVIRFRLEGQLQPDGSRYKVPQMGWNQVIQARPHALWAEVPDGASFYFVHSFHAKPADLAHSVGETDYGQRFTSALARDNIFATQFHPEKSALHGLAVYRNFLSWKP